MKDLAEVLSHFNAEIYKLEHDHRLDKVFNCDKEGRHSCNKNKLNYFLFNLSTKSTKLHRCRTNIIENDDHIIAFFSLAHDALIIDASDIDFREHLERCTQEEETAFREEYCKQTSFPAIKIEYLAVDKDFQSQKIGRCILDYIIGELIDNENAYGCQYITVDALNNPDTNKFYMSYGFEYVSNKDFSNVTRKMYYPLFKWFL